jgi:hypothetical protein
MATLGVLLLYRDAALNDRHSIANSERGASMQSSEHNGFEETLKTKVHVTEVSLILQDLHSMFKIRSTAYSSALLPYVILNKSTS